jgi:hypothetical protein
MLNHEAGDDGGMSVDREIEAMGAIATALSSLDDEGMRARVLRWAVDRFGVSVSVPKGPGMDGPKPDENKEDGHRKVGGGSSSERAYDHFVDLFDAVDPKTDVDKALTAAYWLQVVSKQASWQARAVNNLLKDTGHGLANVTTALNTAQQHRPALVRQMSKSSKAQQAWKTYKLTTSGVAHIRGKLGLTGTVPPDLRDNGSDKDA